MMEQKIRTPQPMFLSFCFHLVSNYNYEIAKKSRWVQAEMESVEKR